MKKILGSSLLGLTSYGCYKIYNKQSQIVQTYELQDIQSDYFMLVNTCRYNKEFPNFIAHLKESIEEHYHYVPQEMDYDKPDFYKDHIAVRKVRFNNNLKLTNSNQIFQGVMYSFIDTHLGSLAAQLYQRQPVATAHIEYKALKKIETNKDYWIVAFAYKMVLYQMRTMIKQ